MPRRKIRVLIVDDSALVRNILRQGLSADPEIDVMETAGNPYVARNLLVNFRPDVMTLDIEMPKMDGITFLKKVMAYFPTPTIMVSSLTPRGSTLAMQALEAGAVDVVTKPASNVTAGLPAMIGELIARVKMAAAMKVTRRSETDGVEHTPVPSLGGALAFTTDAVIGLGASTGGVAALGRILPRFPPASPGIVLVQHMPSGFSAGFATRLAETCSMRVAEAKHGDRVLNGHILVGPGGDRHVEVRRQGGEYRIALTQGPTVSGHTPSVDVFFRSLAACAGPNAAACLLTGMGRDGAEGLLELRLAGGHTVAQDEATSAVWGMPGAAVGIGAAEEITPLNDIPAALLRALGRRKLHVSRSSTRPSGAVPAQGPDPPTQEPGLRAGGQKER
jgi:two-component system chemotaxis response regulator CheB